MNKQDEHKLKGKALDIALSLVDTNKPTLDKCVETGIQMAQWKEQQMIDKVTEWFEHSFCDSVADNLHIVATYDFESVEQMIKDFKRSIKGE